METFPHPSVHEGDVIWPGSTNLCVVKTRVMKIFDDFKNKKKLHKIGLFKSVVNMDLSNLKRRFNPYPCTI